MSLRSARTTARTLAAGAALVACPLAAASISPLFYGTITSMSTTASIGTASGSYSTKGATTYVNAPLGGLSGGGNGSFTAFGYTTFGGAVDLFQTSFVAPTPDGTWAFTMSITITLTRSAYFADLAASPGDGLNWSLNSNPLANNAVISAGTHTFYGADAFGAAKTSAVFGMFLLYPSTGGVPLPGAAGLAAVGLIACRGRRRR